MVGRHEKMAISFRLPSRNIFMRAVARIFVLLSFAALGACTTLQGDGNFINSGFASLCHNLAGGCEQQSSVIVWRRAGGTLEQFEKDRAACAVEAEKVSFSYSWDFFKPDNPAVIKCMKARGYSRTTSQRST